MSRRAYIFALLLVLAGGLLVRLWLWDDHGRSWLVYPGDQDEYYRGAIHILHGGYYDDGQWLRPPLTSIFLASIFAVVGVNLPLAMLVQIGLSLGIVLLLAEFARSLFNSHPAGVAAAMLGAVFLPYASYASQLLSETLFIFLTTASLLIFEAARQRGLDWRWLLAGGLVWGLATLTRPVGLFALPLLVIWVMIAIPGSWRATWQRRLGHGLVLLVAFGLVIVPWTVRNYAVHERLILVDTNGGTSFWLGNLRDPAERDLQFVWNATIPNLADRQQVAVRRALDNISREPLTFLSGIRNKAVSLWQFDTRLFIANAPIGITLDERSLPFALAADLQYVVIMLLGVVGLAAARRNAYSLPLLVWPLYGTLLSAVSLGHPRLRLPLLIAFLVYAALPLAHPRTVWQQIRQSRWRSGFLVVGVIGLALLWYGRVYLPFAQSQFWLARAALTSSEAGQEQAIDRAIALQPDNYLPYVALGQLRREQNDPVGALGAYRQAAERAPQNTYTRLQLFDIYRELNDPAGAQRELEAVAAVGWDNNQLYAWGWRHLPAAPVAELPMAAPAVGLMQGVTAPERDTEYTYRWTYERAQLRLGATDASMLELVLRAPLSDTVVSIWYKSERIATVTVAPRWELFRIPLPIDEGLPANDNQNWVEIRTEPVVTGPEQPYPRGVAVAEVRLQP